MQYPPQRQGPLRRIRPCTSSCDTTSMCTGLPTSSAITVVVCWTLAPAKRETVRMVSSVRFVATVRGVDADQLPASREPSAVIAQPAARTADVQPRTPSSTSVHSMGCRASTGGRRPASNQPAAAARRGKPTRIASRLGTGTFARDERPPWRELLRNQPMTPT